MQILQVARFGVSSYFVQPAYGSRFETGLRGTVRGVYDLDFYLHRKMTALDPAFSCFASFLHNSLGKIDGDQHRPTAFRQPSPDDFHLGAIDQFLANDD